MAQTVGNKQLNIAFQHYRLKQSALPTQAVAHTSCGLICPLQAAHTWRHSIWVFNVGFKAFVRPETQVC